MYVCMYVCIYIYIYVYMYIYVYVVSNVKPISSRFLLTLLEKYY